MQTALASPFPAVRKPLPLAVATFAVLALALLAAAPSQALDLVAFTGITGPLTTALTTIASLTPAVKAIAGTLGFVIALLALTALRNMGPVMFFVGLAVFGAVGLPIAGAILGATI